MTLEEKVNEYLKQFRNITAAEDFLVGTAYKDGYRRAVSDALHAEIEQIADAEKNKED
jgi:hypothetical protein